MTEDKRLKIIVIAGPTASGKTAVSVKLAKALGGEIINADSMQVYCGMDVGTAKPTAREQQGVPHHLLDVVNPDQDFNAAIYRSLALPLVSDIHRRGRVCLLVGGTGLYIKGLLEGLFKCPTPEPTLKKKLKRELSQFGSERLHEKLNRFDPESAEKIHPNDKVRVLRALEIYYTTHQRPSELAGQHGFNERIFNTLKFCLNVDKDSLNKRIDDRCITMINNGLIEETERLLNRHYSPDLKPMKAIGYRHVVKYIKKEWDIQAATDAMQKDTRQYAKRQRTWFRGDQRYNWVRPDHMDPILRRIKLFLN